MSRSGKSSEVEGAGKWERKSKGRGQKDCQGPWRKSSSISCYNKIGKTVYSEEKGSFSLMYVSVGKAIAFLLAEL